MNKPLNSYTLLVTRPVDQAGKLCQMIEKQGWQALAFPTIEIVGIKNSRLDQQLQALKRWQWLIFISRNAVNFALAANNGKIDDFKNCRIAAIGKATADAIEETGLKVDLLPENDFNSEGLLATPEMNQIIGQNCLIVRGMGGREKLAQSLSERGALVDYMEVYSREQARVDDRPVRDKLCQGQLDGVIVSSGEALTNLLALIDRSLHESLYSVPLIVISQRIKSLALTLGFQSIIVTDGPGDAAVMNTLIKMRENSIIIK